MMHHVLNKPSSFSGKCSDSLVDSDHQCHGTLKVSHMVVEHGTVRSLHEIRTTLWHIVIIVIIVIIVQQKNRAKSLNIYNNCTLFITYWLLRKVVETRPFFCQDMSASGIAKKLKMAESQGVGGSAAWVLGRNSDCWSGGFYHVLASKNAEGWSRHPSIFVHTAVHSDCTMLPSRSDETWLNMEVVPER